MPDVVLVGAKYDEFAILHCTSNMAIKWSSGYNTSDLKFRKHPVCALLSGPILCNSKFGFLTMSLEVMIWVLGSSIWDARSGGNGKIVSTRTDHFWWKSKSKGEELSDSTSRDLKLSLEASCRDQQQQKQIVKLWLLLRDHYHNNK